jgi:hypothetical protein
MLWPRYSHSDLAEPGHTTNSGASLPRLAGGKAHNTNESEHTTDATNRNRRPQQPTSCLLGSSGHSRQGQKEAACVEACVEAGVDRSVHSAPCRWLAGVLKLYAAADCPCCSTAMQRPTWDPPTPPWDLTTCRSTPAPSSPKILPPLLATAQQSAPS